MTDDYVSPALREALTDLEEKGNAETLRRYWTEGEGAPKIRWGTAGDFMRCVHHLEKYVSDPKGYCEKMHERATGATPGHAAGEAATMDEADLNEEHRAYRYKHGWIPLGHTDEDQAVARLTLAQRQAYANHRSAGMSHEEALKKVVGKPGQRKKSGPPKVKRPDLGMSRSGQRATSPGRKKGTPGTFANGRRSANSSEAVTMDDETLHIRETSELTERAGSTPKSGRWAVTAISAGLGSSGYYSPEVLQEAANAQLIQAGTPLFFDHPSESQRTDRPERSVRDIAAVFTSPARYDARGQALVGEVQVFGPYRDLVSEMAPHIGLSISGSATDITEGEVEGRRVPVVEGLARIDSVDLVTRAGRGGAFVQLLESAREQMSHLHLYDDLAEEGAMPQDTPETPDPHEGETAPETPEGAPAAPPENPAPAEPGAAPNPDPSQEDQMTETTPGAGGTAPAQEAAQSPRNPRQVMERQIQEQGREIALLRAQNVARDVVAEVLSAGWIGEQQRARLTGQLLRDLPLTESGELDEQKLRETAQRGLEDAETEAAEILEAAGYGTPRGLGALTTPATEVAGKQFEEELVESFRQRGMSDAAIEIAVRGR